MLDPMLNSTMVPLLEQMAIFGERRQEVLAQNVAHIQTPGYKHHDLPVEEFQAALKNAIEERQKQPLPESKFWPTLPGQPTTAQVKTPQEFFTPELFTPRVTESPNLTYHDDGNRSIEKEMANITKNLMTQNYALELMRIQMEMLSKAISEQVT